MNGHDKKSLKRIRIFDILAFLGILFIIIGFVLSLNPGIHEIGKTSIEGIILVSGLGIYFIFSISMVVQSIANNYSGVWIFFLIFGVLGGIGGILHLIFYLVTLRPDLKAGKIEFNNDSKD